MVKPWIEVSDLDDPTNPYAEYAVDSASFLLWSLSGRKYYGTSTSTEQYVCPEYDVPVGCSWDDSNSRFTYFGSGISGFVVPFTASTRQGTRFRLRHQPVNKIVSVEIDGRVLPEDEYFIRNRSELVINHAVCPSLCSAPTVTYTWGALPPFLGKLAAIELANELLLSRDGNEECKLPERVSSITRQGLSIQVYDPQEFLDKGKLGLFTTDSFLQAVNPYRTKKRPKVFSPDIPRGNTRR